MTTTVGVIREAAAGERRVALVPDGAVRLAKLGVRVLVETTAGQGAWFGDDSYTAAGARTADREQVFAESDVLVSIRPPSDVEDVRPGGLLIGLLGLAADPPAADRLAAARVTAIDLTLLPRRLSRAQSMDALTSQANIAGYKAVLVAAGAYGGYLPMLMTAAGTARPAQVLVIGAGVAGLQAIATARRLGAMVTGYDVREAARADIASTGAAVLDAPALSGATADGYARQLTDAEAQTQQDSLAAAISRSDIVITTAQVPGSQVPPLLVPAAMLDRMRPGSVVVDLAAGEHGGNVAGARPDATGVTANGVTVIGAGNLPATVPQAASTAYSRNVCALLSGLIRDGAPVIDPADEIMAGVVVTRDGRIVHPGVRAARDERAEARS